MANMTSTNLDGLPKALDTNATLTVPLEVDVDEETQRLLDAAIEQQNAPCDDIQGWASRLAHDVKDAGD